MYALRKAHICVPLRLRFPKLSGLRSFDGIIIIYHAGIALLTGVILKGLPLRKCVFDVCVRIFYVDDDDEVMLNVLRCQLTY